MFVKAGFPSECSCPDIRVAGYDVAAPVFRGSPPAAAGRGPALAPRCDIHCCLPTPSNHLVANAFTIHRRVTPHAHSKVSQCPVSLSSSPNYPLSPTSSRTMDSPPRKRLRSLTPPPDHAMDSSPAVRSEDEMFPDEALPTTATPHNNALNVSEVSPPNSQAQARGQVNSNGKRPLSTGMPTSTGGEGASAGASGSHRDADTGYQWTRQEDQPGFEWKNTRAREDELRALENIIDRNQMVKRRWSS
jgi:hypothetical protein